MEAEGGGIPLILIGAIGSPRPPNLCGACFVIEAPLFVGGGVPPHYSGSKIS